MEGELLGAEEVARILGVGHVSVWRWCRDGSLPCMKIGRGWRIRRSALEEFMRRSERSSTLVGRLRAFLEVPDNVLAIAQNRGLMLKLDAAFLRVGEARGGTLVKVQREGEGLPKLDELREELARSGLEVSRLEDEGRMRLLGEESASGDRAADVRRLAAEAEDAGTLWIAFNWDVSVGVEAALDQQRVLTELLEDMDHLVLKTAVLEEGLDEWPGATQRRAQVTHSGTIWFSESGLALSRVTPPPVL